MVEDSQRRPDRNRRTPEAHARGGSAPDIILITYNCKGCRVHPHVGKAMNPSAGRIKHDVNIFEPFRAVDGSDVVPGCDLGSRPGAGEEIQAVLSHSSGRGY